MHRPILSLFALMGLLGGGLLATSTVCGQVPSFGDHCGGIIPFVDDDPWFPYALPTATRSDAHRVTERSPSWRFYASGCDPVYDEAIYGSQPAEVAASLEARGAVAEPVAESAQVARADSDDEYVDFPYELTYDDDPPVASTDDASERESTGTVEGESRVDETEKTDAWNGDEDPSPYEEGYEAYDEEYAGDYDEEYDEEYDDEYDYEYGGEDTDGYDYEAEGDDDDDYDYDYDYEYEYEYDGNDERDEAGDRRDSVDDDYDYGSVEDGRGIADANDGQASDGGWEGAYDYEYDEVYDDDYEYDGAYEYDGDTGADPADLTSESDDSDDEYEDFPYELTYDDMPTEPAATGLDIEELVCLLSDVRERVAGWLQEVKMEESTQRAALMARAAFSQLAAALPRVLEDMAAHASSDVAQPQAAASRPPVARPTSSADAARAAEVARKARREARLRVALLLDRVGESLQRISRQMMLELAREDSGHLVR